MENIKLLGREEVGGAGGEDIGYRFQGICMCWVLSLCMDKDDDDDDDDDDDNDEDDRYSYPAEPQDPNSAGYDDASDISVCNYFV